MKKVFFFSNILTKQMFIKLIGAYFYQVVYIYQFYYSIQIQQVTSLFLIIFIFLITSTTHNLPVLKSYHINMSTFFGQAIQQNQQLKINFNHVKQKQQEYYLQLTHAALDVNSNVSHLYLKLQNKEILLLELNRSHPPLFATINIHIYPSDTPILVSKSGKIHVSGYFCKKQEQKVKTLQKQVVQVMDLREQKSKKNAENIQQVSKNNKKPEQQAKVYSSLRSSHPRKAKQTSTSVQKDVIQDKKTPDNKNSRQFFMTKTVVQKQKQTNNKFDKNNNNKDKKQLLDNKKQVKRSSLSMLIKQAEQQDDSEDEDSDESFDQSQQSDDDDEFQEDDQDQDQEDQTPPAKNSLKSQKTKVKQKQKQKQKQSQQTEQKSKSTAIEISQQPQGQQEKRDQNQKILKVWPGMGRIRLTRQQLDKVDFSQWTNLIKAPTKKPSFL